jgi:ribosome-binding factor A
MRFRRQRVEDLLREEISSILFKDLKDPGLGFVTIFEVRMTEDLRLAKVYFSCYGDAEAKEKTLQTLKKSRRFIKFLIGQRVKLRYTPDIEFFYDDRLERIERIDAILKKDSNAPSD